MREIGIFFVGLVIGFLVCVFTWVVPLRHQVSHAPTHDTAWFPSPPEVTIDSTLVPYRVDHYHDTGSTKWIPVDTLAILEDYYTLRWYLDTLKDDSVAFASIEQMVSTNELERIKFTYQSRVHPCTPCPPATPITQSRLSLFAGVMVGRSSKQFGFGPTASVAVNKWQYGAFYDLVNKDTYISVTRKIK